MSYDMYANKALVPMQVTEFEKRERRKRDHRAASYQEMRLSKCKKSSDIVKVDWWLRLVKVGSFKRVSPNFRENL